MLLYSSHVPPRLGQDNLKKIALIPSHPAMLRFVSPRTNTTNVLEIISLVAVEDDAGIMAMASIAALMARGLA